MIIDTHIYIYIWIVNNTKNLRKCITRHQKQTENAQLTPEQACLGGTGERTGRLFVFGRREGSTLGDGGQLVGAKAFEVATYLKKKYCFENDFL